MTPITTQTLENALTAKLMVSFGKTAAEATDGEMMRASALVLRDMMALREVETRQKARQQHEHRRRNQNRGGLAPRASMSALDGQAAQGLTHLRLKRRFHRR